MRRCLFLAGLVAVLGMARPAAAQSPISWMPVSGQPATPAASATPTLPPIAAPMSVSSGFRLADLFHSGPNISNTTRVGSSTFPNQLQMPNALYLGYFGFQEPGRMPRPWWLWWQWW